MKVSRRRSQGEAVKLSTYLGEVWGVVPRCQPGRLCVRNSTDLTRNPAMYDALLVRDDAYLEALVLGPLQDLITM